jgi:hypothetical protein
LPLRAHAPKPPQIDCQDRRQRSPIPPLPASGASVAWQLYALKLLGLLEERDTLSAASADCYDAHRKKGDIR